MSASMKPLADAVQSARGDREPRQPPTRKRETLGSISTTRLVVLDHWIGADAAIFDIGLRASAQCQRSRQRKARTDVLLDQIASLIPCPYSWAEYSIYFSVCRFLHRAHT